MKERPVENQYDNKIETEGFINEGLAKEGKVVEGFIDKAKGSIKERLHSFGKLAFLVGGLSSAAVGCVGVGTREGSILTQTPEALCRAGVIKDREICGVAREGRRMGEQVGREKERREREEKRNRQTQGRSETRGDEQIRRKAEEEIRRWDSEMIAYKRATQQGQPGLKPKMRPMSTEVIATIYNMGRTQAFYECKPGQEKIVIDKDAMPIWQNGYEAGCRQVIENPMQRGRYMIESR